MVDEDRSEWARLASSLSLDEKARLLAGKTAWRMWPMPAIGLREMVFSDGPVGIRGTGENPGEKSDCLPSPTALAACWDLDLARRTGRWLASQARMHGVDVVLGPVANLQRSPISGRHFECFSEDPLLTGDIAVALIRGIQDGGVAACVKHYVGNEVETDRTHYVSRIDESTLREVYLAPFERAIEAGVWCVMAAYNKVDAYGETSSMVAHKRLLIDVLKEQWGFDGPVVSDWTAVTDTVASALGGLDLAMPGPVSPWSDGALADAVRRGDVPESMLDDKVCRLLGLANRVGALRDAPVVTPGPPDPDLPRHLAARACVVLANTDDALPITKPRSIALIGPNVTDTMLLGGGSASLAIRTPIGLVDGLYAALPGVVITVNQGVSSRSTPPPLDIALTRLPCAAGLGVSLEFLDADGSVIQSERRRDWTGAFGDDIPTGTCTVHVTALVFLDEPGEHWLGVGTVGRHKICINGAVVSQSLHDVGGETIIDSSFNVPPAHGSLVTISGPRLVRVEAWVQAIPTQWGPRARASLHHRPPGPSEDDLICQACKAAKAADTAIVVVGSNEETESEGWDRIDLSLPGRQNDLVEAVLSIRPDAIVFINAGSPLVLPWLGRAHTVIWGWFPGQSAGSALADVLTGVTEPAGRLPWTLPDTHEHCPVPYGLPNAKGVVDYAEGANVGYRGWAAKGRTPARPFGFGLGWTSWRFEDARISRQTEDGVEVSVSLTNTGPRAGTYVAQAYIEPPAGGGRPPIWLAGHATGTAIPGEQVLASIEIPIRAFQIWHSAWATPPGAYTIAVGGNASDLPQRIEVVWA